MKKNIKIFFIIFLILLLTVALASFAWFTNQDKVSIRTTDNMNVTVGAYLEIKEHTDRQWGDSLELGVALNVMDCSGDGNTFYTKVSDADTTLKLIQDDDWSGYIIDTYVDIRTASSIDVYLGSMSSIVPVENVGGDTSNTSIFSGSGSDAYLSGWICAASRVAFFEVSYDENDNPVIDNSPICVWAPNAKVQYDMANNKVLTNGEIETIYSYYTSATETTAYTTEDHISGKIELSESNDLCTGDRLADGTQTHGINHAPKLLSFRPADDKVQEKHLLVRIWFEGTDREAEQAFNNGKVNYNISLAGVTPKTAPHTETDIAVLNGLKFAANGGGYSLYNSDGSAVESGKFLYSLNGISWMTVDSTATFSASSISGGVYIALNETADSTVGRTLGNDVRLISSYQTAE